MKSVVGYNTERHSAKLYMGPKNTTRHNHVTTEKYRRKIELQYFRASITDKCVMGVVIQISVGFN
jgi:hypothetical protein